MARGAWIAVAYPAAVIHNAMVMEAGIMQAYDIDPYCLLSDADEAPATVTTMPYNEDLLESLATKGVPLG
jgi:hypothetical protein